MTDIETWLDGISREWATADEVTRLIAELRKTRAALANCPALVRIKYGNTDEGANAVMAGAVAALEGNHE